MSDEGVKESSDLEGQMRARQKLVEELRAAGTNPYANDFRAEHEIASLERDEARLPPENEVAPDAPHFSVAGRLIQVNDMGKAKFLFLRGDKNELIQLYLKADYVDSFAVS